MTLVVKRIASLIIKQWRGELTVEETIELEQWTSQSEANRELLQELSNDEFLRQELITYYEGEEAKEAIWKKIEDATNETTQVIPLPVQPHKKYRYMAAAVTVGALLTTAAYFWYQSKPRPAVPAPVAQTTPNEVLPGGNKAMLKLSDGKTIVLDNANNGVLATQGAVQIEKQEGQLEYTQGAGAAAVAYNTLSTPVGGQFQIKLPDGTRVWLNAASSITYPTTFSGNERRVTITGEGYFEVARNASKPFKVTIQSTAGNSPRSTEVEVLGTHFNINAYDDEDYIKTTLLEGSIKFKVNAGSGNQHSKMLSPGQQAVVNKDADNINVENNPDAESSISWVKGVFHFEKANLDYVMRQLSRWYDVQVEYEGPLHNQTITGDVGRNIKLSRFLELLGKMGKAKYTIQGKTVKVIP